MAGPVQITKATVSAQSRPGLLAAAVGAGLTLVASGARLLLGDGSRPLLLAGVLLPLVLVGAVAIVRRRSTETAGVVRRFTLRTTGGRSLPFTLRDDSARDALQPNDMIRVVPGRRAGTARRVEVLATLHGPVLRRLTARPPVATSEWPGLAAAAFLLATAATVLAGAF